MFDLVFYHKYFAQGNLFHMQDKYNCNSYKNKFNFIMSICNNQLLTGWQYTKLFWHDGGEYKYYNILPLKRTVEIIRLALEFARTSINHFIYSFNTHFVVSFVKYFVFGTSQQIGYLYITVSFLFQFFH